MAYRIQADMPNDVTMITWGARVSDLDSVVSRAIEMGASEIKITTEKVEEDN